MGVISYRNFVPAGNNKDQISEFYTTLKKTIKLCPKYELQNRLSLLGIHYSYWQCPSYRSI